MLQYNKNEAFYSAFFEAVNKMFSPPDEGIMIYSKQE